MSDDVRHEVDQLLRDREKYEAWLQRLDSEKPAKAGPAFDKVRNDYKQRLQEVLTKLQSHGESLQSRFRSLEAAITDLESEKLARIEELDEARLRRSVGEYRDDNKWADLETRLQGSVEETERQLERTAQEIATMRQIVSNLRPAAPEPAPQKMAPQEPPPPPPPPPPAAPKPLTAEPEPFGAESEPSSAGGDEGFLSLGELVFGDESSTAHDSAPTAGPPTPPPGEPAGGGAGVSDELAFLESLSLGGNQEGESFSFLQEHGSGTPQTIICPHCSAANDPAEWYCTECGEELPAE